MGRMINSYGGIRFFDITGLSFDPAEKPQKD